ncbi:MAG: hypothetical protein K9N46_14065 [Candidatus Marinimicrobia bacterium]|nr:hypothetical protein [Candidatus Neomarinimicrobiota bacterium]MCF7829992.1 hypothetical protein [Candidatus Neomarinimicrobiota bacterium]MCF7881854.1 hypothetical protein [Candidatus Neomarinimicrobiota bacterium]
MKRFNIILVVSVLCMGFWLGCTDTTFSSDSGTEVTLTHEGFDFSEGKADTANYQNSDGETIVWAPDGESHPDYSSGIWWRTYQSDENNGRNQTKDYGIIDLSEVSEAPTVWDVPPHTPLRANHVFVAKCRDGYVKFKVLETDTTAGMWPAQVKYLFSETTQFP